MITKLQQFTDSLDLLEVFLKDSKIECNVFPLAVDTSKVKNLHSYELNKSIDKSAKIFICYIKIGTVGKINDEEVYKIENNFALVYGIDKFKGDLSNELQDMFLSSTAFFNAYPYHREQIQNQSLKMGLPPIVLPLHKPRKAAAQEIKKVGSKKKAKKVVKKASKKKTVKKTPKKKLKKRS